MSLQDTWDDLDFTCTLQFELILQPLVGSVGSSGLDLTLRCLSVVGLFSRASYLTSSPLTQLNIHLKACSSLRTPPQSSKKVKGTRTGPPAS